MPIHRQFDDPVEPFGCRVEDFTTAKEKNLRHTGEQRPKEPDRPQLGVRLEAIERVSEKNLGRIDPATGSQVD